MTRIVMMQHTFRIASLLLLLSLSAHAQDRAYALTNVNVFNGVRDRIAENRIVLVSNGKIERIARGDTPVASGYEVIDCESFYLMPGMMDAHTHILSLEQARRALESGVTTVRTAGTPAYQDVSLRELARAGKIAGPDVVAAGVFVTPNLEETILADPRLNELAERVNSDDELRLLVQVNADRGVDVIKTRGTERAGLPDTDPRQQVYTERQLRVVVEEAAKHDIPVMVHAHGDEGARAAVLAGARSIEHGTYLSRDTLRLMKERGTWFVPTWITMQEMNEEQYDYVLRLRGKHMVPQLERAIREAYRQGVKIATGADNYYDDRSINRISLEVEAFVRLGMSNFDALQTATVNAAELLRVDGHTGRIEEGLDADLILVPGNPLEDIAVLQDVLLVMSNGQIVLKRIPFSISD
ncbi:MAG: amidohydrolase family protein [Woeseiaceae bacterium]|nr:amidohydrolase family protein [Woeseiaceae bacterium]